MEEPTPSPRPCATPHSAPIAWLKPAVSNAERYGTLYTGVTSNLLARVHQHREGLVAGFTRDYAMKLLVWFEQHATMDSAITREKRIKKWNRAWKLELIEAANPDWRDLAEDFGFDPIQLAVIPANAGDPAMNSRLGSRWRGNDEKRPKGLRQFLDSEQQRAWLEGESILPDGDRPQSDDLEQRFKFAGRFEKLLRRPEAGDVLDILRLYAATAIPIPRRTERFYWSVSCLPGSPDKPLTRISASFMELFALHARPEPRRRADADDLRARFILHLSDFTADASPDPDQVDTGLLESLVERPEDVSHAVWRNGREILIAKIRGAASIRAFLAHPHGLRAIRRFNLTHMNRGRNAYQASHCYSLADVMLDD